MHSGLIDHRYSFNTANDSTNGTTGYKPVYIVGAINSSDGLFYLDSTKWWTQTLPTSDDGKLYIYIGDAYDYYRMTFVDTQRIYWYKNGKLREYTQDAATTTGHTVLKDVPSDAKFTDTTYESKAAASGGTAVSLCTTGEKYTWNNKTSNTGTVTKVSTGAGLTGGDVTTTGTIKCDLKSETKSTLEAASMGSTANKQYAVGLDKNGDLSVNIPWTDNNTTYSFTGGTNKFTYTPSGGTATDVTITPSITNNITGSGTRTSGYIAKFSGQNTITNGPQIGSSTTTYLRNDGTWVNPQNVYVGTSAPTATNYQVWVDPSGAVDTSTFVNIAYPVGAIYKTTSSTNPATTFPGTTWQQVECQDVIARGAITGTYVDYGSYEINAHGEFEAWYIYKSINMPLQATYDSVNMPYPLLNPICQNSFGYGGANWDHIKSYCWYKSADQTVYIYWWNFGGATATDVRPTVYVHASVDLANNNLSPIYAWKRLT